MRIATIFVFGVMGLFAGCGEVTSTSTRPALDKSPAPDNTAVNKRDSNPGALTPLDQNENKADIKITADIRRGVLDEAGMSINARNCKIITADGKVTLRGPVKSQQEKDTIARIANSIAGEGSVDNQLEVKAP